jgi:tetratricopeptide (TPR) repeat protein
MITTTKGDHMNDHEHKHPREDSDEELWGRTTSEDPLRKGMALQELAQRYCDRKDWERCLSAAAAARETFNANENFFEEARAAYFEGFALYRADREEEALPAFSRAVELYRTYAGEVELADALHFQGMCFLYLDRLDEMIAPMSSAIALYEGNKRHGQAGFSCLELGQAFGRLQRQAEALEVFERCLENFQKAGDVIGSGRAHDRIAAALIDLARMDEATDHLRQALQIFEYTENEYWWTKAQYRLGWTLVIQGEYAEALPLLEAASRWYKKNEDYVHAADADGYIAEAYRNTGREADARRIYRTVQAVYEAAGQKESASTIEMAMASSLADAGETYEAIHIFRRMLKRKHVKKDKYLERQVSRRLASQLVQIGGPEASREGLMLLLESSTGDWGDNVPERAAHLAATAEAFLNLEHFDDAEKKARAVLEIGAESTYRQWTAASYKVLSDVAEKRDKNRDLAEDFLSRAIALYLANGDDAKARELSQRLLPDASVGINQEQWVLFPEPPGLAGTSERDPDGESDNNTGEAH